ncbi:MAG: 50S ribosomal protein L32 [Nitrospirae bacterium CG_4_9_14_3_um_filter_53_35]|nr:MAG: 50S ribosomal protein L32 [Nitrospirae bacterium CG08_land_8_20_14_0_20_52_24]PIV82701.1 MAG: 50S ribosomal protein L32 [Nitrospirae bacterium CG17_big_fil_post_rev_8_21_14_2_50_50_9]PIW85858.1 MAG: 50S ribosomal protein L32 [Nitrospirae bacterium CG_4_8_14_3_um_filter_50_41]PIX86910.1 MAG: 50S ribosomal protein L32 [Nitrospirae bacterium CG_4_10_14_3_um_filter_53_41]PJA77568.1 MAG: 50S ribosomal protein L32 [Nitrospirae bacterium CG_4_9_14_3_um_filter_53_35]
MPVPKRKKSKSRRDQRRAHIKVAVPSISTCPKCHEHKLPHYVCPSCGYYKGREVIVVEEV